MTYLSAGYCSLNAFLFGERCTKQGDKTQTHHSLDKCQWNFQYVCVHLEQGFGKGDYPLLCCFVALGTPNMGVTRSNNPFSFSLTGGACFQVAQNKACLFELFLAKLASVDASNRSLCVLSMRVDAVNQGKPAILSCVL